MKNPSDLTRREILAGMLASGAASFITGARAEAPAAPAHAHDWDWLLGDWDVFHSRLKDRLVKSTEWQEFKVFSIALRDIESASKPFAHLRQQPIDVCRVVNNYQLGGRDTS